MKAATTFLMNISVAFRGTDLIPDDVARTIGLTRDPTYAHERGDAETREGVVSHRDSGFCVFNSDHDVPLHAPFEQHVDWFVQRLEPHKIYLRNRVSGGWSIDAFVATFLGSVSVHPADVGVLTLSRLCSVELPVRWLTPRHDPTFVASYLSKIAQK